MKKMMQALAEQGGNVCAPYRGRDDIIMEQRRTHFAF